MGAFTEAIRLPSAKFPTIGSGVAGTVVEIGPSPVPSFDAKGRVSGNKLDDAGVVVMQVDVTLDTETERVVLHTGGSIYWAIGKALATIGAEDLVVGDTLTVNYISDGEATVKGRNAPKQYSATVTKG